jgi:hypothetical protein
MIRYRQWVVPSLVFLVAAIGCAKTPAAPDAGLPNDGAADASVTAVSGTIVVSAATRKPRANSGLGTNYWSWSPTYGNLVVGSEAQILALAPVVMRIGGYNNDANTPDPFNDAQVDAAMVYAKAIGAQPILQVPLLKDVTGAVPTATTAAAMVTYANVTKAYGVKYFSIGNEPDLYPEPPTNSIPGYTPAAYCASATAYVAAMKAVDPTIAIVGPELSWKYQSGGNDWLTPILQTCGGVFDVISIHRYPIDPAQTTAAAAAGDAPNLRSAIEHVRSIMKATGVGDKPLAITECNITWDGDPAKSTLPASPGTLPAGLWAADAFGVGLEAGLWATAFWSTREGWTLGLLAPADGKPQPEYWALQLYATHFGPTLLKVTSTPTGVHAYASRNAADTGTQVFVVNWNAAPADLAVQVTDLPAAPPVATWTVPAVGFAVYEIPDAGPSSIWIYGADQQRLGTPPQPLVPL